MARVKLSEYDAKRLTFPALNLEFHGFSLTSDNYPSVISSLPRDLTSTNLVVKVDQGIKKRGKLGLVKVNCTPESGRDAITEWSKAGWSHFFVEPVYDHAEDAEHYLAIERTREGWAVSYSEHGGIEVEKSWESVKRTVLLFEGLTLKEVPNPTDIFKSREGQTLQDTLKSLLPTLERLHLVFLEMNPVLVRNNKLIPLDMAAEVDSASLGRGEDFIPVPDRAVSESEAAVAALDATTPASLKFRLINPNGKIWMFLSGGGASLVLADEVADQGMGGELANYGEYSGAPTDDDVYAYTKIILTQLLKSNVSHLKSIIVAGGVANFTDVAKTFKGLIRALGEQKTALVKAKIKVFVRRGGPNEVKGLKLMEDFLTKSKLLGSVHGHDVPLTEVVTEVKEYLK
jgi:ATP citrate (pro-S)-lyase